MLARLAHIGRPDEYRQHTDAAQHEEGPFPAEARDQPAGKRRENSHGEVLRRAKQRGGATAFCAGKPHNHYARVCRKGGRFYQPQRKAQRKHQHQRGGHTAREFADEAHRNGGKRPERQRDAVNFFRAEAVKQQAAGDLADHIGPAKGGEDQAELDRRQPKLIFYRRSGDRQDRAVSIGHHRKKQDQAEDPDTHAGGPRGRVRFCHQVNSLKRRRTAPEK